MQKISGAKLHTFDFRDYALLACASNSDNLLDKTTPLSEIAELSKEKGVNIGPISTEWKAYLEDADVYDLTVVTDDGGSGGSVVDNLTKETVTVKKFGKVPKDYKKAVFRNGDNGVVYVAASKINSAVFHKVKDPSWVNYCVNRAIAESHFSPEKYEKNASVAEKKLKENAARVTFKVSDSARNKIMVLDHKKLGICAAIYMVDPKKGKKVILTFGGSETPTTNIEEHYHFPTNANPDSIPGFVGNLAKHLLFASAKVAVSDGSELGKGDEKLSALFKAAHPIIKALHKNKLFVGFAMEAVV